jgi:hypothetical protein
VSITDSPALHGEHSASEADAKRECESVERRGAGEELLSQSGLERGSQEAAARSAAAPAALPCLNRNNSIAVPSKEDYQFLSSSHRKTAFALKENVEKLAEKYGVERIGFFTPTFADNVQCAKEAGRRFNSLNTNILKTRYAEFITVIERMKTGRIHFHCLVVLPEDIRTGFDFVQAEKGLYSSASKHLRAEWAFWRKTAKEYGFGRCEMLPVKSTAEGIAKYVGKYISKHIGQRQLRDKGVRLVRYSNGANYVGTKFMFNSPRSKLYRHQLSLFAAKHRCVDLNELYFKFGAKVHYSHAVQIRSMAPTIPELLSLWEFDRLLMAKRVADSIGATPGDVYLRMYRPTEFDLAPRIEIDCP